MSSIRTILDTNDETVYPQTVANAVNDKNGITMQHILDSMVYVGQKGKFDQFGDIDMTLNPATLEDVNISNSIINFSEEDNLYGIDPGDSAGYIAAQLQVAIQEIQKLKKVASYPNILINSDFSNPISQEDIWSMEYTVGQQLNRPLDCWIFKLVNKTASEKLSYRRETDFIRLTLYNYGSMSTGIFYQPLENPNWYSNKNISVTLSYRLSSGEATMYCNYVLANGGGDISDHKISLIADNKWHTATISYKITATNSLTKFCPIVVCLGGSKTYQSSQIDISYAKVEESSYPTTYQKKLLSEELRNCQRYFYSFHEYEQGESCHFLAFPGKQEKTLISILELPTTMYDIPIVECGPFTSSATESSSMVAWSKTTSTLNITDVEITVRDTRRIVLRFTVDYSGTTLPDVPYTIILNELMYIDVKAFIE